MTEQPIPPPPSPPSRPSVLAFSSSIYCVSDMWVVSCITRGRARSCRCSSERAGLTVCTPICLTRAQSGRFSALSSAAPIVAWWLNPQNRVYVCVCYGGCRSFAGGDISYFAISNTLEEEFLWTVYHLHWNELHSLDVWLNENCSLPCIHVSSMLPISLCRCVV